jgi:hypothetical protein
MATHSIQELEAAIEALIDRSTLQHVLAAIVNVCGSKGQEDAALAVYSVVNNSAVAAVS